MIVVYMLAGTLAGLMAGVGVGVSTGSVFLGLLAWSGGGAVAIFMTASVVYLRQTQHPQQAETRLIPAE